MLSSNLYLLVILLILVLDWLINTVIDLLNAKHMSPHVPEAFTDIYQPDEYKQSQQYQRTNTRFGILSSTCTRAILVLFILLGGFGWLDQAARGAGGGLIITGLLFALLIFLFYTLIELPWDLYDTFVIEERFGFNKTTPITFVMDRLKSFLLLVLLGGPVLALIIWFFSTFTAYAWLYAWGFVIGFQLLMMFIAPAVILPLFNKFTPLEDGSLRDRIMQLAEKLEFPVKGLYKIDGSRRSTKANAYFTGLGRWRRIALYDTLIEKHTEEELAAVLAHEIGHFKLGHIWKGFLVSMATTLLMFALLAVFIKERGLYEAFDVSVNTVKGHFPIYAGLLLFSFLYTPVSRFVSLYSLARSRKHEFEADAYAADAVERAQPLIQGLKKLSKDNMSNLTPHPLKVFMEYSHPPVLTRISHLQQAVPSASRDPHFPE